MIINQFGIKNIAPPKGVPLVDCRVLPNPFQRGVSDSVLIQRVRALAGFEELVEKGVQLLAKHNEIYVFCLYGKHRSGAVSQEISARTGAVIKKL